MGKVQDFGEVLKLPASLKSYPHRSVSQASLFSTPHCLKGRMILRCVKKAISYRCPYVIAIVVPHQIYTAVVMTICANQENNIV